MMQKRFIKYITYFTIGICIVLISLALYLYFNKNQIKLYAINQINTQLTAKVDVNEIDLELFKQFPYVSLDFNKVVISESANKKKTLLNAAHIYLSFNIYDILLKKYQIKQITIDSGLVNLYINNNGEANFNILKSTNDSTNNESLLAIKDIQLNNLSFTYLDQSAKQDYVGKINQSTLSFTRDKSKDDITCNINAFIQHLKSDGLRIIEQKPIQSQFKLNVDEHRKIVSIAYANIQINDLQLSTEGSINYAKNIVLKLHTNANETTIPKLLSILPITLPESFKSYESNGDIKLNIHINGEISKLKYPEIKAEFLIHKGTLTEPNSKTKIENIECNGQFSNGNNHRASSSELNIQSFSFNLDKGKLSGNLSIKNLDNPTISLNVTSQLPVAALLKFNQIKGIKQAEGQLSFNCILNGLVKDFKQKNIQNVNASGTFLLDANNIILEANNRQINSLKMLVAVNGESINLSDCNIQTNKSDINITGVITQYFDYLFNNKRLTVNLNYNSRYMDVENILFYSSNKTKNDTNDIELPERINMNIAFNIDNLKYHLFEASALHGKLAWQNDQLELQSLSCKTMNGQLDLNATLNKGKDNHLLISANTKLQNINLSELFRQCADFGQSEITYKHINGVLNGKIEMMSVWTKKLTCVTDKLYAFSDIHIKNGELNGYKPLESLSRFADIDELRTLKFSDLSNKIQISNRTITIPEMDATNNALNITLSGTHTFDNMIDYRFKIKLKELLAGKRKSKNTTNEYDEVDESGKGLYLYLSMKGNISDPKISYDKIGVKNKIIQSIQSEKETLKSLFKKEFGIQKDTTIKEKENNDDNLEFERD